LTAHRHARQDVTLREWALDGTRARNGKNLWVYRKNTRDTASSRTYSNSIIHPNLLDFLLILKHCFFHKSRTVTHLATVSLKMFSRGLLLRRHCLVAYLQFIYNIILSYIEEAWHGDFICACTCMYNILCKRRNILCQTLLESLKYNMLIYMYMNLYTLAHYLMIHSLFKFHYECFFKNKNS